ncbi:Ig-like domain-containing protein [Clostridium sp. CS001]|uniref:Ig-like domain-containing protein n=1 Tax=Clostridium sp. CS001 TaxID=2880648 RepID=UPI001CF47C05|nr:Ig-like domain-containing protein [Clostridium sp. CS001]MCB2289673.1 Ig-like domain-containing protein [Clostridium sp. CS001]
MKSKNFKNFTVLFTAIFIQGLLFGQLPKVAYGAAPNVTINVKDGTGTKDSLAIQSSSVNKYLDPTILQGTSYMDVNVNGAYNFFKYQFINQSAIPVNIPTGGWNNLDLTLKQQVNNDDVITTEPGKLNWRGYDVNHLPTVTNTDAWQNSDIVFKYPSAATNYKSASVSTSWGTYGEMQSVVPYTVTTVDNKSVTVTKKWVSNTMFMTGKSANTDLTANTSPDAANYKESSKFWGYMNVPTDGKYYFGLRSDDGSNGSLTVDGVTTKFTDMFKVQGTTWGSTGRGFDLKAKNADGTKRYYPIYLEYFNWGGAANFEMKYYMGTNSNSINNFTKSGSGGMQAPSTWFYPSKNVTPGEYATTTFTGSSGVQFPTNPGDYYIAYQTGTGSTVGSQGFYGPFTIEGKSIINVSKEVIGGVNKATEKSPFTLEYTIQPPATIPATNNFKDTDGRYKSTITLTNIMLQDVFPAGININTTSTDIAVSNQSMVMTAPNIVYTYNGNEYAVSLSQTQVKKQVSLTASSSGNYMLSSLGSSILTFSDVNIIPTNGQVEVPSILVNVVPKAPVINTPTSGSTININKPLITGTSNPNVAVNVYVDGVKISTVTANGNGYWTYTPTISLSDGKHNITATATDSQGNTSITSASVEITINTGKPALGSVMIKSNNENPIYAKVGDIVTLNFKEANGVLLGKNEVTIAGHVVKATIGTDNAYTATYQMLSTDTEGIVPFTIDFSNTLGSVGTQVTASTDSKNVTFNKTNPTLTPVTIKSNNVNPLYAKVGDSINLSFTASEALLGLPVITIAGHSVTAIQGVGNSYTATYLMLSTDNEGIVPYTIDFKDLAGNIGIQVIRSTDHTSVTFDKTAPTAKITYSKNPAKAGEVIITATYSEPVNINETPQISIDQKGTLDINNQNMEVGSDRRSWTFKYTVNTNNGGTYIDGEAIVGLSWVHDAAGNTSAKPTENTFTIDTIPPSKPIITADITAPTTGDIKVTIVYPNDAVIKNYRIGISGNWLTYNGLISINTNCTIYAQCEDLAGNASEMGILAIGNIDKSIIKTGLFINNKFSEQNTVSIVKGFNTNLAVQITNLIKQEVTLEMSDSDFVKISDIKVYAMADLKNPIDTVKIIPSGNIFTIKNLTNASNNYLFVLKTTAIDVTKAPINNIIKVNGFIRPEKHYINVVKLPQLQ